MTETPTDEMIEKLVSTILGVLDEKELTPILRKYTEASLESLIPFLYETYYEDKDEKEAYAGIKRNSFLRTKRRWARTAIRNLEKPSAPYKELKGKETFLKNYIQQFGLEQFRIEFNMDSLEQYMEKAKEELLEWAESEEMPTFTYPFIHEKTKKQRNNAIQIDLAMMIGDLLIKNKLFLKPTVYQSPNFAITTSFFGISPRGKLAIDSKNVSLNEPGSDPGKTYHPTIQRSRFATNSNISLLVSSDFVNDLNKKVPDLDNKDFELFLDVLMFRDASFQTTRRIQFPLKELVKRVYDSDNAKNYQATIERILKLANYRVTEANERGEYFVKGLFSSVRIQEDSKSDSGERLVTAFVSEDVYDDFLRQQVVNIYSDKVMELKGRFSYHLVFVLQKERIMAHQMKETNPVRRSWLDFRYAIRFNKRTKKENLEEFERALDEIKEREFVIQDYYRSGEYFFFTFYPLSELELNDFSLHEKVIE
ncbi:hypothetical protein [Bacillus massilinigeriensis]|uniref:hypothetical protein n=1 Tax=Bacillus mediterraneensis TaxID=1805474 RepID=UPI0008F94668|nr:hypothetical protein [Bacillus mediterraneensis]